MQFLNTVHCIIFISFRINVGIGTYFAYYRHVNRYRETSIDKKVF